MWSRDRMPILRSSIAMQVYPISLLLFIERLPESPRWYVFHDRHEDARKSLEFTMGPENGKKQCDSLLESAKQEQSQEVGYTDMFTPSSDQFHPTMLTVMGQINQALTGYGGSRSTSTPTCGNSC